MLPGNLNRAPRQPESCSWATGSTLLGNPFIWEHARARAGTTGNRLAKSNQISVLTATAELRTYKIDLLGKSEQQMVILGNGFNRVPGQLIAGTNTSVLPGNLRSIPDMIPCEANCFLFV